MEQFIDFFTKAYESICNVVLTLIQSIKDLVASITKPDVTLPAEE